MTSRVLFIFAALVLASCAREELAKPQAESNATPPPQNSHLPPLESFEKEEAPLPAPKPPPYSAGNTFQGMWNYDRRNANLRMNVISVDSEDRTIEVTIQSGDLDNGEKKFTGTFGDDGSLKLDGVKGTGSDYERDSSYHVRNLLDRNSTMQIELTVYGEKIKGAAEDGTNLYFFTRL